MTTQSQINVLSETYAQDTALFDTPSNAPIVIEDVKPSFDDVRFVDQSAFTVENEDAPLVQVGDIVYCECDYTGAKFEAEYIGWYIDFNSNEETSPYFSEAYGYEEIHRLVVRRLHDGGTDYILPGNCLSEAQIDKYWSITVKA